MSAKTALLAAVPSLSEEICVALCAQLGINVPADSNHDTPGMLGDVALLDLRATRPETHFRFVTREIVNTMPDGPEKAAANHQIGIANAWYHYSGLEFSPCRDAQGHAIANLYAVPDVADPSDPTGRPALPTVQSITDALNERPDPVTNAGGDGFHH